MKHIHFTKRLFLAISALVLLATGCIHEDLDACFTLTLKVVNQEGAEITGSGDVVDATIFVYDENEKYLETVTMNFSQIEGYEPITLKTPYREGMKLYFVAWGNIAASKGSFQAFEGQTRSDCKVQLSQTNGIAQAAGAELFGGHTSIVTAEGNLRKDEVIVIEPKIGSISMFTFNLPSQYYNQLRASQSLEFGVEKAKLGFDADGGTLSDLVAHNPEGEFGKPDIDRLMGLDGVNEAVLNQYRNASNQEWLTQEVNDIIPTSNLIAQISDENGLIHPEVEADIYGNPFTVEVRKEKVLVFEWDEGGTFIGIRVITRPWGYVEDEIEF